MKSNAGQPARQTGRLIKRETIGPPECPILTRWTLLSTRLGKLMLHRFHPNADDRAVHDHPAPFWTFVLRGFYDDMRPCEICLGEGFELGGSCDRCSGLGVVLNEQMSAGTLRFRPAVHPHRTRVGPEGCWTIVLMGPKVREWGFWRGPQWLPWREHERRFGFGMRCPDRDRETA